MDIKKIIEAIKLFWKNKGFTDIGFIIGAIVAAKVSSAVIAVGLVCFWAGINLEQIKQAFKKAKDVPIEGA